MAKVHKKVGEEVDLIPKALYTCTVIYILYILLLFILIIFYYYYILFL